MGWRIALNGKVAKAFVKSSTLKSRKVEAVWFGVSNAGVSRSLKAVSASSVSHSFSTLASESFERFEETPLFRSLILDSGLHFPTF